MEIREKNITLHLPLQALRLHCQTAHSRLKLLLNKHCNENPTSYLSRSLIVAKVWPRCDQGVAKLMVWDEFTMAHKNL